MANKCLDSGNVSQRQAVSINTQEDNNIYIKNAEVCQYENSIRQYQSKQYHTE